jgi:hypothetical protein
MMIATKARCLHQEHGSNRFRRSSSRSLLTNRGLISSRSFRHEKQWFTFVLFLGVASLDIPRRLLAFTANHLSF